MAVDWLDALGVTISGEAVGLIIFSEKQGTRSTVSRSQFHAQLDQSFSRSTFVDKLLQYIEVSFFVSILFVYSLCYPI